MTLLPLELQMLRESVREAKDAYAYHPSCNGGLAIRRIQAMGLVSVTEPNAWSVVAKATEAGRWADFWLANPLEAMAAYQAMLEQA